MGEEKPASSFLGVSWSAVAVIAFVLVLFLGAIFVLPLLRSQQPTPPVTPPSEQIITQAQFEATLQGASALVIVQDVRNAPDNLSRKTVQDCGVNLARSLAALGKNVTNYAYEAGDVCYTYAGQVKDVRACEQEFNGTYALIVSYGSVATTFYQTHADIATNPYYGSQCAVGLQTRPPYESNSSLINPNATAIVANMTPDELFSKCIYRDYCLNSTAIPEEQQTCLSAAAGQTSGDPTCCFGLQNLTSRDTCLLSTAVINHGGDIDLCQFVSSPIERDKCYFKYGYQLAYAPYCEFINETGLRQECASTCCSVSQTAQ
ncbi:Uncharacterised protein [Candidatus Burarchaeum australiense]|nr:Uncharacterised protein [Candidatus Burarchaeum australiense]